MIKYVDGEAVEMTTDEEAAFEAARVPGPEPVPQSVTPRQARLALLGIGLLDQVEAAVAAADKATQVTWKFATEVRRDDPLIAAVAASLDPPLTDEQIDDLFRSASTK